MSLALDRQDQDGITVQEAARLLQVSRPTVYRLIERGRLHAARHPVTGRPRLSRQEVQALATPPVEPEADSDEAAPAAGVQSIFQLPALGLDFGLPDLSDRVDAYRFGRRGDDETSLSGHLGADRGQRQD